jgi:hypothetical protein
MNEIATRMPVASQSEQETPLKMIPQQWREMVTFFWMCNSHILKDSTAICARFKMWIADGLDIEDARKAFRSLMTPEASARFQYAGQLLAELSLAVAEAIKRKRERERQEKFQREADEAARSSVGVVSNLANLFKGSNG